MAAETKQTFWLLLDTRKGEAQFMAECPTCGAITTREVEEVWRTGFVVCECGLQMAVVPETMEALRRQAFEMEAKLTRLLTPH